LETLGERGQSCDKEQEKQEDQFDAMDAGCFHGGVSE
jgi:hypothetical protein